MTLPQRLFVVALMAASSPGAGAAGNNPRETMLDVSFLTPPPVTEPAQMGAWLGQLVGRYRVEGLTDVMGRQVGIKGAADCESVGKGPGLHCIFNIYWEDLFEIILDPDQGPPGVYNLPGGVPWLRPSMMLIGLDPAKGGLTHLLVDNKGLPEGGSGSIAGNVATLRAPCVNAPALFLAMNPDTRFLGRPPATCERITRIDTRPGSRVVNLSITMEINREHASSFIVILRREPPGGAQRGVQGGAQGEVPGGMRRRR